MLILFILYNFAISIIFLAKQIFPFQVYPISSLFMTLPLLASLPILKNFCSPPLMPIFGKSYSYLTNWGRGGNIGWWSFAPLYLINHLTKNSFCNWDNWRIHTSNDKKVAKKSMSIIWHLLNFILWYFLFVRKKSMRIYETFDSFSAVVISVCKKEKHGDVPQFYLTLIFGIQRK